MSYVLRCTSFLFFFLIVIPSCSKADNSNQTVNQIIAEDEDGLEEPIIEEEPIEQRYIGALEGLNLRSGSEVNSSIIAVIPFGEKVEILDKTGSMFVVDAFSGYWTQVKWDDLEGWVFSGYLTVSDPSDYEGWDSYTHNGFEFRFPNYDNYSIARNTQSSLVIEGPSMLIYVPVMGKGVGEAYSMHEIELNVGEKGNYFTELRYFSFNGNPELLSYNIEDKLSIGFEYNRSTENEIRLKVLNSIRKKSDSVILAKGENIQLETGSNIISWTNLNPEIVEIDNEGYVKALESGEALIRGNTDAGEDDHYFKIFVLNSDNASEWFISKWKGSTVEIPLSSSGEYDFYIDWGDGTAHRIQTWNDPYLRHTYSSYSDELHTIRIYGKLIGYGNDSSNEDYHHGLVEISQWGSIVIGNTSRPFRDCDMLHITAKDAPDLSQTESLAYMFSNIPNFSGDLSKWDTSNITNMSHMFYEARLFNSDLSSWDTSNVEDMDSMFYCADSFNSDISSWDTSSVTNMSRMFYGADSFNSDISDWDTSSVTDMSSMFYIAESFNSDLSDWDTSNVTDISSMFSGAYSFDSDLSGWETSNVREMDYMFSKAESFNSDLSGWDTSSVTDMAYMFRNAKSFNSDLSGWETSNVRDMAYMFSNTESFNSDISGWDVGKVVNIEYMFYGAESFNSDLSGWDVSSVINMDSIFRRAVSFNSDISQWDVSSVENMRYMFSGATLFNQDLSSWELPGIVESNNVYGMFYGSGIVEEDISDWPISIIDTEEVLFLR